MKDDLKELDTSMKILCDLFIRTKSTEIADALDILSEYHAQCLADNGQFGVGA